MANLIVFSIFFWIGWKISKAITEKKKEEKTEEPTNHDRNLKENDRVKVLNPYRLSESEYSGVITEITKTGYLITQDGKNDVVYVPAHLVEGI